MKKRHTAVKIGVTAGLMGFLLYRMDLGQFVEVLASARWELVFIAALVQVMTIFLSVSRWRIILENFQIHTAFGRLARITFIGSFFNLFLPSAIGGDFFRAFYLSRAAMRGMSTSLTTVLLERSAGLFALLAIGLTGSILYPLEIEGVPLQYLFLGLMAGYLLAKLAFFHPRMHRRITRFFKRFRLEGVDSKLDLVYQGLLTLRRNAAAVSWSLALSLLIQLLAVVIMWIAALAIRIDAPFWVFLIFIPIVNLTIMIPLTINGHGLRESIYFLLFSRIGVPVEMAVTLSILNFVVVALASLPGGVIYSLYKKEEHFDEMVQLMDSGTVPDHR